MSIDSNGLDKNFQNSISRISSNSNRFKFSSPHQNKFLANLSNSEKGASRNQTGVAAMSSGEELSKILSKMTMEKKLNFNTPNQMGANLFFKSIDKNKFNRADSAITEKIHGKQPEVVMLGQMSDKQKRDSLISQKESAYMRNVLVTEEL